MLNAHHAHARLATTALFAIALIAWLLAPAFPIQAQAAIRLHNEDVPE